MKGWKEVLTASRETRAHTRSGSSVIFTQPQLVIGRRRGVTLTGMVGGRGVEG